MIYKIKFTVDQQQQHRVNDTCTKLFENPSDSRRFCHLWFVTGNEIWWVFYRNFANKDNVYIKPAAQLNTAKAVAKQDRFAQNILLCLVEFRKDN